ncbi:MAG: flagellar filament capping protein FliD [Lachnospiraceae bacterium]|nr:flagellar filament capping protein FliD [Lachnospiraceae bacterium]
MAIRMTGLISGMDTEGMVKELVAASSTKVNKVKQEQEKLEWKQEAWQDLNTKLYNFYKGELFNFKSAGTYNTKKATSSDDTKVKVSAGANAPSGSHTVSVKQLASSAYLTGASIKSDKAYVSYSDITTSTNFADMTDADGNSLALEGQTISISSTFKGEDGQMTTEVLEFTLGGSEENSIANLSELNSKLAANKNFKGLKASMVDGKITFTNSTGKENKDFEMEGTTFNISADALGMNGELGFKTDKNAENHPTLESTLDANYKKEFTGADINKSTKLTDIGINVGTTFSINGKDYVVDDKTTIATFTEELSKMGVGASFDANHGRFYINSSKSGVENNFELTSSDANALEILGLGSGATKVDAQDAIIEYNGVEYTGNSNTFEINGLTITANSVTGTYNKETGEFTNDAPININVAQDTDKMYDSIKTFVNKYNELIEEMNKLYNEKTTDYEPLTDEERSQLSETQIEKWEEKAKQGLLRRDSTIDKLLTNMRNILNKSVEVTMEDGSKQTFTLASLGIVTGDYTEKGKLHILGDEDDSTYSSETNKLKAALEANPEIFAQVFAGAGEANGIGEQLYDSLTKSMARTSTSRSLTFYDDISMEEQMKDYEDDVEKWQEKLQKIEDKYYDQFAAMESAMAALQQQQSYIASLMGM